MKNVLGIWILGSAQLLAGNLFLSPVVTVEPPSFTSIGFQVRHDGDDNHNTTIGVRYRLVGASTWRTALSLIRVPIERVTWRTLPRQFAGSIFDLRPGGTYEYELSISDPDGFSQTIIGSTATRALPTGAKTPRQVSVNSVQTLQAALSAARPGDVITVQSGNYPSGNFHIQTSGTADNPITIRGVQVEKTVIDGQNCECNVFEVYASHVRVESFTIVNAFQAIRYFGPVTGNHFTRNVVKNVKNGVNTQAGQSNFLIADNQIHGRVAFAPLYPIESDAYGIQMFGSNHILAHNEIQGVFDGIRLYGAGNRNVDIYGNDIIYTADDGMELDESDGNIRVLRNRVSNTSSAISTQPVAGGPAYILRNVVINPSNEQIKFHALGVTPPQSPSGVYVYQNTFVSPTVALGMYSSLPGYDSHFRNNIFYGPASGSDGVKWDGPMYGLTFNSDGYFPTGKSYWNWQGSYIVYASVQQMISSGLLEAKGRPLNATVFLGGLTGPSAKGTYVPPQLPRLSSTGNAIDGAEGLANINDMFKGPSADLGALESGCPPPLYGPRPAGVDESNQVQGCTAAATAQNTAPKNISVDQDSRAAASKGFTATITDADGAADIERITLLLGPSTNLADGCAVLLKRNTEQLYLYDNTGTSVLGPIKPGAAQTLANSKCSLDGAGTSVTYDSKERAVKVSTSLTLDPGFRNLKKIYLNSVDLSGAATGWTLHGASR